MKAASSIVFNFDHFSHSTRYRKSLFINVFSSIRVVSNRIDEAANVKFSIVFSFILFSNSICLNLHLGKAFFFYSGDFARNLDALQRQFGERFFFDGLQL